jgi:hypothetical protein
VKEVVRVTGRDLLQMQFSLQRIGFDDQGLLIRLPGPNPDGIPRFYCGLLASGAVTYFRQDVPPPLRQQLGTLPPKRARDDVPAVCAILAQQAPCEGVWRGVSAVVAHPIGDEEHREVRPLDPRVADERALLAAFDVELAGYGWPAYAVVRGGRVLAACVSSREDDRAGEAWVQTRLEERGRGYGRQATAAWAHALQRAGKLPFYSHEEANVASAGVARSLGLQSFVRDVGYL